MAKKPSSNAGGHGVLRHTRRRTSPEDQAVLEAAFKDNPKPDKATRTELLKRVSLGEKEIAVSIIPPMICHLHMLTLDMARFVSSSLQSSQGSIGSSFGYVQSSSQESQPDKENITPDSSQSTTGCELKASFSLEEDNGPPFENAKAQDPIGSEGQNKPNLHCSTPAHDNPSASKSKPSEPVRQTPDTCLLLQVGSQPEGSVPSDILSARTTIAAPLKRTASQPRLCTSLDGSVRVKTGISPSPSPPRRQASTGGRLPRTFGPLQRSQSAIVVSDHANLRAGSYFGRSRDSRTWTFHCDANSRDELSEAAELDRSGSAAGAIMLMRSGSKGSLANSAKSTIPNKRNTGLSRSESAKRSKTDNANTFTKPILARATSSVARLQSSNKETGHNKTVAESVSISTTQLAKSKKKNRKPSINIFEDGSESDKENWLPGTQISAAPRRHPNSTAVPQSSILRENAFLSSQPASIASRRNAGNGRHGNRLGPKHKPQNEVSDGEDEEVARFMGGGGSGSAAGGGQQHGDEEQLAGVHGLLSLSQGAWF
ncbi:MAG: hypothetical protein L6R39_002351 [Caloplaca ligustica]|nr:MAG: hypothetical protein L6R39_002351 [Caloplaca ligustica]